MVHSPSGVFKVLEIYFTHQYSFTNLSVSSESMADPRAQRWLQQAIESSIGAKGFKSVPREVLFPIADDLPTHSRVALALASKFFFTSLYPDGVRIPEVVEEDRKCLLLSLEKDKHHLRFCFGCLKLVSRHKPYHHHQGSHPGCGPDIRITFKEDFNFLLPLQDLYRLCPGLENSAPKRIETSNPLTWRPYPHRIGPQSPEVKVNKWPEITFAQAYGVMQRHRLGERYGLPIDSLEKRFEFKRYNLTGGKDTTSHFPLEQHTRGLGTGSRSQSSANAWHFTHHYSAKIAEDELLIRRSHVISAPYCSVGSLSKVIDSLELPVCAHIFASAIRPDSGVFPDNNGTIPELHFLWLAGHFYPRYGPYLATGSALCPNCNTVYSIKIESGGIGSHWSVMFGTYHNLGRCQDPDDPSWRCLTDDSLSNLRRNNPPTPDLDICIRWHGNVWTLPTLPSFIGPAKDWVDSYPEMLQRSFPRSPEAYKWKSLQIREWECPSCGIYKSTATPLCTCVSIHRYDTWNNRRGPLLFVPHAKLQELIHSLEARKLRQTSSQKLERGNSRAPRALDRPSFPPRRRFRD